MADALGDGEGMGVGEGAVVDLEGHVRTVEKSAQRGNGGRGLFELSFEAFKCPLITRPRLSGSVAARMDRTSSTGTPSTRRRRMTCAARTCEMA